MPPRSLSETCIRKCVKNLNYLNCVGDLTYEAVRPILLKVASADQLREIEVLSPQLQGEDAEIWQKLIAKDFPGWEKKNYYPKNPLSWHLVYRKYKQEQAAEIKAAEAKLVSAFATLEEKKQSNTSKIVDQRLLPKPPGRRARRSSKGGGGGGALGGSSFLKKARREAKEHASRIRSTPTGALAVRPGQIKKAPEAMVNDYRIAAQTDVRIRGPRMSKPKRDIELEAREARLLAAKGRAVNKTGADIVHLVSDDDADEHDSASDLDDSPDEKIAQPRSYLDDLFDDEELQVTARKIPARHSEKSSASPPKKVAAPPAPKQETITPAVSHKPRTGLLSNAYKATAERPHVRHAIREPPKLSPSPVKQSAARLSPQARPQPSPERKADSRQMVASSAASPTSEASPPAARISPPASPKEGPVIHRKRKMPVDIFMPKKTQRH